MHSILTEDQKNVMPVLGSMFGLKEQFKCSYVVFFLDCSFNFHPAIINHKQYDGGGGVIDKMSICGLVAGYLLLI